MPELLYVIYHLLQIRAGDSDGMWPWSEKFIVAGIIIP